MTTLTVHKLPKATAPVLFAFIMSASLGGVMSALITAINTGFGSGFLDLWLHARALAFALAFTTIPAILWRAN